MEGSKESAADPQPAVAHAPATPPAAVTRLPQSSVPSPSGTPPHVAPRPASAPRPREHSDHPTRTGSPPPAASPSTSQLNVAPSESKSTSIYASNTGKNANADTLAPRPEMLGRYPSITISSQATRPPAVPRPRSEEGTRVSQILNDGHLPNYPRRVTGVTLVDVPLDLSSVDEKSLPGIPDNESLRNGPNVRWTRPPPQDQNGVRAAPIAQLVQHAPANTVQNRLNPTLENAVRLHKKAKRKAVIFAWALNIAIGLQVVIGALITGLSAVTTGRNTSIMTSVLGAFSTIIASFLARARGTNEPERSRANSNGLEKYIRDLRAFLLDFGHESGEEYDQDVRKFREALEELQNTTQKSERMGSSIT
ncbi:hypothetical protein BOTBODRAFT_67549 [Botryobasidium botryosum FD-172 SS1]|uniref:SMODS and SLOG-associating 2TM effector domain-containing protein n=1 Tax=Botryobasidium botryosum (strain FD-172 SS1) TaxID=930990 RepID=A0A067MKI7_BOTB1|nr:hypothetical protein BOTBODRAFT_67549 [Botryobasidium botryosum FD-172 SS1]